MKKFLSLSLVVIAAFALASCGTKTLTVTFVPSRDSADILDTVEPLQDLLSAKLAEKGYDYDVVVEVSSSYEAAGEALDAGTTDIAFLPGGTYALYSKDGNIDVALAATRSGLSKDSPDAIDWNDDLATTASDEVVTYYRGLVVAGPSEYGQVLAAKVNSGEALTWADLDGAKWGHQSATSSSGTIYPSVYLYNNYDGMTINDLTNHSQADGYGGAVAGLLSESYDVVTMYADARRDYEATFSEAGMNIWTDTAVIIVTDGIFNDTISISKETVDSDLKAAIQEAFIELAETEEGAAIFSIYSHSGYKVVTDSDYDAARVAQAILEDAE
jgi:phosphonate transport system substrate-binding protein